MQIYSNINLNSNEMMSILCIGKPDYTQRPINHSLESLFITSVFYG